MKCPSDGNVNSPVYPAPTETRTPIASRTNIAGCLGDTIYNTVSDFQNGGSPVGYVERMRANNRGFFPGQWKYGSFGAMSDGSSNTVAFAERAVNASSLTSPSKEIKGSLAGGLTLTSYGTIIPTDCAGQKAAGSPKEFTNDPVKYGNNGMHYGNGYYSNAGFTTVLPPNSPSCSSGTEYAYATGAMILSASSNHTGGVNIGLGDGSVQFISDTINSRTSYSDSSADPYLTGEEISSGRSPYGIWGAYGTRNGGESASL